MFDRHAGVFREIEARGVIKPADVQRLGSVILHDGITNETQAETLLALDAACPIQDVAWLPLLVRCVSTYIVAKAEPRGYMTASKARWLIDRTTKDGRLQRLSCLELLIDVIETARWAPPSLPAFVLRQIEADITTGKGPLRTGATSGKGRVGKLTADYIRRVLAASSRDDCAAITRVEAEVLLDIHDATAAMDNCVEWTELFTKAMADLLMTASGYAAPDRAQLVRREPWFDPAVGAHGFLEAMTARGFDAVLAPYKPRNMQDRALAHLEHHKLEIITAETIAQIEPAWLARRLSVAPVLAPESRALLSYLRIQQRLLHPELRPLLDRAA